MTKYFLSSSPFASLPTKIISSSRKRYPTQQHTASRKPTDQAKKKKNPQIKSAAAQEESQLVENPNDKGGRSRDRHKIQQTVARVVGGRGRVAAEMGLSGGGRGPIYEQVSPSSLL